MSTEGSLEGVRFLTGLYYELNSFPQIHMLKFSKCPPSNNIITLLTKVYIVKAMVYPVVMYGCESWTIKKLSVEELMLLNCGAG